MRVPSLFSKSHSITPKTASVTDKAGCQVVTLQNLAIQHHGITQHFACKLLSFDGTPLASTHDFDKVWKQMCHEKNINDVAILVVVQLVHLFVYSTSKESNKCSKIVEVDL